MKIILATHHFPPKFRAGGEQYALRLARHLQQRGHAVDVVCIESITTGGLVPTSQVDVLEGIRTHRLFLDLRQAPDPFRWSYRNPELGNWFRDFLGAAQPDLVHINSGYLLTATVPEAAREAGLPTVLTLHDYWFLCPMFTLLRRDGQVCTGPVAPSRCVWCQLSEKRRYRTPDTVLGGRLGDFFEQVVRWPAASRALGVVPSLAAMEERRAVVKPAFENIDVILCPSRFLMDKMKSYGFQPRRMLYLPFGLELTGQPPARRTAQNRPFRIGYLGQIAPHKGVHLLVQAFRQLRKRANSAELIIYGSAPAGEPYGRALLASAEGDGAITFAGVYPNDEVSRILADLDVIVVPSTWYENRPTVIVEAFASQTPVLASNLGGMAEMVQDGVNGLLFQAGSSTSLAGQLQRLLDDPGLLPALRAGVGPVQTIDREIDQLLSVYSSLVHMRDPQLLKAG